MRTTAIRLLLLLVHATAATAAYGTLPDFSYHVSNHRINAIAQDADGFIWLGTSFGLNRYSGENFLTWYASDRPGDLNNDMIYDICFDSCGDMWLATECGIICYSKGVFKNANSAVSNPVHRIIGMNDSTVVASGRDGVLKFDKDHNVVSRFFRPGLSWIRTVDTDSNGHVWIVADTDGIATAYVLDSGLGLLKEIFLGRDVSIRCMNAGLGDSVWIVSSGGTAIFDAATLERISLPEGSGSPASSIILEELPRRGLFVTPYDEERILIGLAQRGMYLYDSSDGSCTRLDIDEELTGSGYSAFVDRDRNIWLMETGREYRLYSGNRNCTNHSGFMRQTGADRILNISPDSKGRLWMSADNGYIGYDPQNREIIWTKSALPTEHLYAFVDSHDRLWTISRLNTLDQWSLESGLPVLRRSYTFESNISSVSEDENGNIWVINNFSFTFIDALGRIHEMGPIENGEGLQAHTVSLTDSRTKRVFVNTVRAGLYECFPDRDFVPVLLGGDVSGINSLVTTGDGTMWMGTFNQGLVHFNPADGKVDMYNIETGLSSNSILSLMSDDSGRIWFNTPAHIICYDPATSSFNTIYDRRFSDSDFYTLSCAARTPQGKLYFGGYGGLTEVDAAISFSEREPDIPLHFEYIAVNGEQVPMDVDRIELNHRQKLITVMFSGLNLDLGLLLNYSYMLKGYDRNWTYTDKIQINYSNLPPGRYTLMVRVRYMNGKWSSNELSLPVIVRPAPWATVWAKTLYALVTAALAAYLIRTWSNTRMRKRELLLKQERIDFVSNISHDLRTPLSLISGPLSLLKKSATLGDEDRKYLDTIERNAERMRVYSEELIDSPATRSKDESLEVSPTDISSLIHGIANNFRYAALEKTQTLETDIAPGVSGYIDSLKIEKALVNLISNALKYTPSGGRIAISLHADGDKALFRVSDNGSGIAENKRKLIFERFERIDKTPGTDGSGIGLNWALHLTRMHHGTLEYSADPETGGSVFTLGVPICRGAYSENEISDVPRISKYPDYGKSGKSQEFVPGRPTVLVAEDNPEISAFIAGFLQPDYNVISVSDGLEAMETLNVAIPDIVVSDIVMPRKDGYALCHALKQSPEYCHIPVILLTAKTDSESGIRGLGTGADAYLGKPFDPDFLKATIASLIANRRRIQQKVLNMTPASLKDERLVHQASLSGQEVEFLKKVHSTIEEHLDNEEFSIEQMARELGVSYSKLYAKIKALTGHTPQEFTNTFRMNKAMELLQSGNYNVSEVAYMVGASSPFNFSRDFKKHFGLTPSSIIKGKSKSG